MPLYRFTIDIPQEYADSYRATLGFKANHSFRNNCGFTAVDHPRFGFINAIVALKDVAKDEEIFAHYGYEVKQNFNIMDAQ
jgi:SET domain-containing protein